MSATTTGISLANPRRTRYDTSDLTSPGETAESSYDTEDDSAA